jgi:drug/metabolite transporter (DMT)-like permease
MDVALALLAAVLFAFGTVLQQRVAASASDEEAARAGFLLSLARRPVWLAGIACDAGGLVCQAAALAVGRLVVVQPILASYLMFTLPIGAWLEHRRIRPRAVLGALTVACGLAVFLVVADPAGGRDDATLTAWIISGAICGAVCVPLAALAVRAPPARKAALLGSAAGVLFGLSAALIKATVERLDSGVVHMVADWHLWALIIVGYVSMALAQRSLQVGRLAPAVATQTAFDPITSLALGVFAFDETIHETPLGVAGALAAIAVMLAGVLVLATSRHETPTPAPALAQ